MRTGHIRKILRRLRVEDPWAVTTDQLVRFLAAQRWKPNTRRSHRASLRAFYGWARDQGHVETSPAHRLPAVKAPRSKPRPTPEPVYHLAVRVTGDRATRVGIRLAGQCGLRRGEIARVHTRRDLEPTLDGHALRVVGKGGHVRLVPLPEDLAEEVLGLPDGWLFPSPRRLGEPMTPHTVGKVISRQLPEGFTTHSLRHRCATVALRRTKNPRAVQELLGHAKLETIMIYTLVDALEVREAMLSAAA